MPLVEIDWSPDSSALRRFGIATLVGFVLFGLIAVWHGWDRVALACFVAGGLIGLPALSGRTVALPGYRLWMAVAFVMGNIVSRVVMIMFYYLLLTPLGLIMRVVGRDRLQLRKTSSISYWHDVLERPKGSSYDRTF